jgi:hypothetical protein
VLGQLIVSLLASKQFPLLTQHISTLHHCYAMQADKLATEQRIFAPAAVDATGTNLGPAQRSILPTVPSLKDPGLDPDCCTAAAARLGPSSLPPLHEDTYVDKATLSRLFMVSSHMSKEVQVSSCRGVAGIWLATAALTAEFQLFSSCKRNSSWCITSHDPAPSWARFFLLNK